MDIRKVKIYLPAVRVNAKMTQEQWANELGYDKCTIVNWEAGRGEPNVTTLRKMSELSGIPMDFIFCEHKS